MELWERIAQSSIIDAPPDHIYRDGEVRRLEDVFRSQDRFQVVKESHLPEWEQETLFDLVKKEIPVGKTVDIEKSKAAQTFFSYLEKTEPSYNLTDSVVRQVEMSLFVRCPKKSILTIFDELRLSDRFPIAHHNSFYKIVKNIRIYDGWIDRKTFVKTDGFHPPQNRPHIALLFSTEREPRPDVERTYKTNLFIVQHPNGIYEVMIRLELGKRHVNTNYVVDTILPSLFDYELVKRVQTDIQASFKVRGLNMNPYILLDLVSHGSILSHFLVAREKSSFPESSKNRINLVMSFDPQESIIVRVEQSSATAFDTIVKVHAKTQRQLRLFRECFARIGTIYDREKEQIRLEYAKEIPNFSDRLKPKVFKIEKGGKSLSKQHPYVLAPNEYARFCGVERQPTSISREDIQLITSPEIKKLKKQLETAETAEQRSALEEKLQKELENHYVLYPEEPTPIVNKDGNREEIKPIVFACVSAPNENGEYPVSKHPYINLNKNKTPHNGFDKNPCCSTTIGGDGVAKGLTNKILKSNKIAAPGQQGHILQKKQNSDLWAGIFLQQVSTSLYGKQNSFLRVGVSEPSVCDSLTPCIAKFDKNRKISLVDATDEQLQVLRQTMPMKSVSEIRRHLETADYLSPYDIAPLVELLANVRIFLFNENAFSLPNHSQFYAEVHSEAPIVMIYVNSGSESNALANPHCELIVANKKAKLDSNLTDFLSRYRNNVVQVYSLSNRIVPRILSPEVEYRAQSIDDYGKTRSLIVSGRGKTVKCIVEPIAPLPIPDEKEGVEYDVFSLADLRELFPSTRITRGIDESSVYILIGNVRARFLVEKNESSLDIERSPFGLTEIDSKSVLDQFKEDAKYVRWLQARVDLLKYVYGDSVNDHILVADSKREEIVDFLTENDLVVDDAKIKTRLLMNASANPSREYTSKYIHPSDFTYSKQSMILYTEQSLRNYSNRKIFRLVIHLSVQSDLSDTYFFLDSRISQGVILAVNTPSLENALGVCNLWRKRRYIDLLEKSNDVKDLCLWIFRDGELKKQTRGREAMANQIVIHRGENGLIYTAIATL